MTKKLNVGIIGIPVKLAVAFALVAVATVADEAQAHPPIYGNTACGPGYVFFENSPSGTSNVLAATSNGISGFTHTFAVSSQTSGCSDRYGQVTYRKREQENFVAVNWDALEQEMAAGSGEKLDAFAALLGCPNSDSDSDESAFADHARRNHGHFFDGGSKDAPQFVSKVKDSLRSKPSLAASCSFV